MEIYAGQTLEGTMVFTDDNGNIITDFSQIDIKILLRNRFNEYSILLQKDDMQIDGEKVNFSFSPDQTAKLCISAVLEIKLLEGEIVRITKEEYIRVIDNLIKDM